MPPSPSQSYAMSNIDSKARAYTPSDRSARGNNVVDHDAPNGETPVRPAPLPPPAFPPAPTARADHVRRPLSHRRASRNCLDAPEEAQRGAVHQGAAVEAERDAGSLSAHGRLLLPPSNLVASSPSPRMLRTLGHERYVLSYLRVQRTAERSCSRSPMVSMDPCCRPSGRALVYWVPFLAARAPTPSVKSSKVSSYVADLCIRMD